MNNVVSLRNYINANSDKRFSAKTETFCRLMKKVSDAIEKEERNLIRINLDEIMINETTNEIILPDYLFSNEFDKTVANFKTGISLIADRKSTNEHKKVAMALMILGWYVDKNAGSINSDIEVLENFDHYMTFVPNWLKDYFINIFKKMDYTTSFGDYYRKNFVDQTNKKIYSSFSLYELTKEQLERIKKLVIKETINMTKGM